MKYDIYYVDLMCMSYEAFGEDKWGAQWGRDECNDEGLEGRVILLSCSR